MRKFLLIWFLALASLQVWASGLEALKDTLYHSYLRQDIKSWKPVIKAIHNSGTTSVDSLDFVLEAEYGYVAWCVSEENEDSESALEMAFEDLERYKKAIKKYPQATAVRKMYEAKAKSYNSAFLAYQLKLKPIKAVVIGWKCVNGSKEAIAQDSTCWFSQLEYGNVMYYLPTILGGSNINAINAYKKAMKLMEGDADKTVITHNWLYIHLMLCMADVYKTEENYKKTKELYEKILRVEPSYGYVRNQLMPTVNKLLSEKVGD